MNSISVELTMQELAQTALGVPKITGFNLSVLQSLIDLILKKLDCQNETVTATGYESQNLQQLLRQSKISPLPFKDEKLDTLSAKMKRLSALEDRMAAVMKKLDDHMSDIRIYNEERSKQEESYLSGIWQHYSKSVEDMCTIPTDENRIACKLIINHNFVVRLMRLVAEPLTQRMREMSQKIENLHLELLHFTELAHERYKKIGMIDGCLVEIEILRKKINEEEKKFLTTIAEIQEQLDGKVAKGLLKDLTMQLKKVVQSMKQFADEIKAKHSCPDKPTPPKSNTTDCLSCGGVKTCSGRPFNISEPYNWAGMTKPIVPPYCGCLRTCLDSRHQKALRHHIEAANARRDYNSPQPYLTCQPPSTLGELRGENGVYYRKD